MKKGLLAVLIILGIAAFSGVNPAYAYLSGWELDLNSVVTGLGDQVNVDRIVISGDSTITQSFGLDGAFNNGDTFVEGTLMQSMTYWATGNAYKTLDLTAGATDYTLYAYGAGLTGHVYNVNQPSADPTTWSFDYVFDPGNLLYVYLDTDNNPTNGVTATLAQLAMVPPSGGQGPAGFLGGSGPNGTSDITSVFTYALPGVWKSGTLDFASLPTGTVALGLVNTHNDVQRFTPTETGFSAYATSNGELRVDIVPEPATMLLFGIGASGLAARLIRRKKVA